MGDSTDRRQSHRNHWRAGDLVKLLLAPVLCGSLVLLFACTGRKSGIDVDLPGTGKTRLGVDETLRVNLVSEPPGLDWQKSADTTSSTIVYNIMQGLIEIDVSTPALGMKPALATKWEMVGDAGKWKITLREGVKWSDGVPFTAQHVIDSWHRLLARETASPSAYFLFNIKNAKDFNAGKKTWDDVGVKMTGPLELTIDLVRPLSYFPYFLTHHTTFPIRKDIIDKYGDRWTDPRHIVTLGHYNLRAWSHDRLIVLERNPLYWGAPAHIKYVAIYMIQEQATAINLFDSDRLDAVHGLPSVEIKKQRTRPEFRETPRLTSYYIGMNVTKPPMNNVLLRKALAMAIDRSEVTHMLNGGQKPLSSWVPPGMFGYEPDLGMQFNPEKARAMLKQAGFAKPLDVPTIEFHFNTNDDHQRIAEDVQAQLKRNLGIRVELKNEEWKIYLSSLHTDPPQMFRMGWQGDFPDPDNFMSLMTGVSENNYTRWKNPAFDALVDKASTETVLETRRELYRSATRLLTEEDVPVIPVFTGVDHALIAERLKNYPLNAIDFLNYAEVELK